MVIVDTALRERHKAGKPVRVGIIGAGFMARGLVNQIYNYVPGMRVAAVANRNPSKAMEAFEFAGVNNAREVGTVHALEACIEAGQPAYTGDALLVCRAAGIDIVVETTGDVEYGAVAALECIRHGKDMILLNAELDGTVGPILKQYADEAGVILSGFEGDQPGLEVNLYRYVRTIGLEPLVCGNIKGLQDSYRNPETQKGFAEKWGMKPAMVASFADGTKVSFEQAVVANATGMSIAKRGMNGWDFTLHKDELIARFGMEYTGHIDDLTRVYDPEELRAKGGIVDYVVGLKPPPGVYVIAEMTDKRQQHYLNYYKLGAGPLYSFYTPMHICHFDFPISIARVALFRDAVTAPVGRPKVDVIAIAKKNLKAGEHIDGFGGFCTYGECETYEVTQQEGLLPIGLAEGCILRHDVAKDSAIRYADVIVPDGRVADRLRAEQTARFPV